MKVLFAINSESREKKIIDCYKERYGEKLEVTSVYFFKSLLETLKRSNGFDRIVIHEELEAVGRKNQDVLDNYIFKNIDSITDESGNANIIFICGDQRRRDDKLLARMFNIGIYNILIGEDRTIGKACELINKPKTKKDAKKFLEIDTNTETYEDPNRVDEMELRNIVSYYEKNINDNQKIIEAFESLYEQYTLERLKVIIGFLPSKAREVLSESSDKYRAILGYSPLPTKRKISTDSEESEYEKKQERKKGGFSFFNRSEKRIKYNDNNFQTDEVLDNEKVANVTEVTREQHKRMDITKLEGVNIEPKKVVEIPKVEIPKVEPPKVEPPRVEPPKVEPPRVEPPKVEIPGVELPKVEMPKAEPPKAEPPKVEPPKVEPPKVEPPKVEPPKVEMPKVEPPRVEPPRVEIPKVEMPKAEPPKVEIPRVEPPRVEIPRVEPPRVEIPRVEIPRVEIPKVEKPKVEPPRVEIPKIQENSAVIETVNAQERPAKSQIARGGQYINDYAQPIRPSLPKSQEPQIQTVTKVIQKEVIREVYATPNDYKKIVAFVGAHKVGTTFIINAIAQHLANRGVKTAILDLTVNKDTFLIYAPSDNEEKEVAANSIPKLAMGDDMPLKFGNLSLYTGIPRVDRTKLDYLRTLEIIRKNNSVILVDTDSSTPAEFFRSVNNIFVVQDMDILNILPITAFIKELKNKQIDLSKIEIIINKYMKSSLTITKLVEAISIYTNPEMTFVEEILDKNVKRFALPFDQNNYLKYMEGLFSTKLNFDNFTEDFRQAISAVIQEVYPISGQGRTGIAQDKGGIKSIFKKK